MAAFVPQGYDLANPGVPEHAVGIDVSAGFFQTLGVKLALGREFTDKEDRHGGTPVAVISDRLRRERWDASRAALGTTVTLNGRGYAIVGVLPPELRFLNEQTDVYTPIGQGDPLQRTDRTIHNVICIARLQAQLSLGQAQAEMNTVQAHPEHRCEWPGPRFRAGSLDPGRNFVWLLPVWKSSKTDPQTGLKDGGRGLTLGHQRTQRGLVVGQIALAVVLLAGGSLLLRTIRNLWAANPGFNTHHLLTFQAGLSSSPAQTSTEIRTVYQHLLDRIRQIPGVQAVDIITLVPLSLHDNSGPFWIGSHQPASMA